MRITVPLTASAPAAPGDNPATPRRALPPQRFLGGRTRANASEIVEIVTQSGGPCPKKVYMEQMPMCGAIWLCPLCGTGSAGRKGCLGLQAP